jgi:hypothetical protein
MIVEQNGKKRPADRPKNVTYLLYHIEPRRGNLKRLKIWVNFCKILLKLIYPNGIIFTQLNLIKYI